MFLGDVLVYSHTRDGHIQLLRMVFDKLREHQFCCRLNNCSFFCMTTTLFGFDVTLEGLKISNAKVKSLCDRPLPMTVK